MGGFIDVDCRVGGHAVGGLVAKRKIIDKKTSEVRSDFGCDFLTPRITLNYRFLWCNDVIVSIWSAVTIELPGIAHLADQVKVQITYDEFLFVWITYIAHELATRSAEVALTVEIVGSEILFDAYPVDGAYKVAVGDGVTGLLDVPQSVVTSRAMWPRG